MANIPYSVKSISIQRIGENNTVPKVDGLNKTEKASESAAHTTLQDLDVQKQPAKSNGPLTFMEDRIKTIQEKIDGTNQVYQEKFDRIGRRLAAADKVIQEAQATKQQLAELRLQEISDVTKDVETWFKNEKEKREEQD